MSEESKPLVLVTGASGYIAGHCVIQLLEAGYRVRGTIRNLGNKKTVARLESLVPAASERLELVQADLASDGNWSDLVKGCTYVLHVASPFPASAPDDENDLIRPAVEGTMRVLRACAATRGAVKRVVLTSSVAAVAYGHPPDDHRVFTEEDWSVVEACDPYQKSKTLAERVAWEFAQDLAADERFELSVINPGFVAGPVVDSAVNTSVELVRRLMTRAFPACPKIGFAIVDVRDIAAAHILAMTTPDAAGQRYICAGDHYWIVDIARILDAEFRPLGYRVPTGNLPYSLMWLFGRFDKSVRMILPYFGRKEMVSHAKATAQLGWQPRPAAETILDTAYSLVERGVVKRTAAYRPPPTDDA
ncbi:MAG: SDR family oxidoreductase [Candidatus Binatia bacterium]